MGMLLHTVTAATLVAAVTLSAAGFVDVTEECGVKAIRDSKPGDWWLSGLHLVDIDADGDLDLFLSAHGGGAVWCENDGAGNFSPGKGTIPTSEVHTAYDIDEDGKVDLAMTHEDGGGRWWLNRTAAPGQADFEATGIMHGTNTARIQAMLDIDRDGKVDWIYQGTVDHGDGKGGFGNTSSLGVMGFFFDMDGDGDLDLAGDGGGYDHPEGTGYVFRNTGGAYSDATAAAGLSTGYPLKGCGDVDKDGDMDLVGLDGRALPPAVFINDGFGSFARKEGAVTGRERSASYGDWGLATTMDLDNDGNPDIMIDGKHFLNVLRGSGDGTFTQMNEEWGIKDLADASVDGGLCFGDIDSDGDLDVVGYTDIWPQRHIAVYRNDLPKRNWLRIRPVGAPGNKGAAGAKIRLYAPGTRDLLWYEQVWYFGSQACQNYYAYDIAERHVGLGDRSTVDVEVEFYPSGDVRLVKGVEANRTVRIAESGDMATGGRRGAIPTAFVMHEHRNRVVPVGLAAPGAGREGASRSGGITFYAPDQFREVLPGGATGTTVTWDALGRGSAVYVSRPGR